MSETPLTEKTGPQPDAKILMPLPDRGFDPSEAGIPWKVCTSRGWTVVFSTERGGVPQADASKLKGPLPGLLSASEKARSAYAQMSSDPAYLQPIPYDEIDPSRFRALLLPGGDALELRQYLENPLLQGKILQFWRTGKLIGAICHGILPLARTIDPETGKSVLFGRMVTALPAGLDRAAYKLDRWLVRRGYIMYPQCVEQEVRACLKNPSDFSSGRSFLTPYSVTDGNLITARWYLDAELFAGRFTDLLAQQEK